MFVTLKTESSNMRTIKAAPARASQGQARRVAAPAGRRLPAGPFTTLLTCREKQTVLIVLPDTRMINKVVQNDWKTCTVILPLLAAPHNERKTPQE